MMLLWKKLVIENKSASVAAMAVNQELIKLHWWIGSEIVRRQEVEGWGGQVIERLCKDVQSCFPGLKGFSRSNVFRNNRIPSPPISNIICEIAEKIGEKMDRLDLQFDEAENPSDFSAMPL
jgi:hypothetical protein